MAPIKFEEDIKNKLEKRAIQPSAASWNSLSKSLDNEEKNNSKKGFLIGLAASIIGVLLVTNLFFKDNNTTINSDTIIVEESSIKDTLKIETPKQIENTFKEQPVAKIEIKKQINKTKQLIVIKNSITKNDIKEITENVKIEEERVISLNKNNRETSIAQVEKIVNKENKKKENILDEAEILISQALANTNNREVELINSETLLTDVEEELNQSFRTKIFTKIKNNVSALATTIAERNN